MQPRPRIIDCYYILNVSYRQTSPGGVRLSRAAILQKGIEYIAYLNEQSAKQLDQLESLKKEVTAMRIMKENYEMITRVHQSSASQGNSSTKEVQVPEELKFRVVGSNVLYVVEPFMCE